MNKGLSGILYLLNRAAALGFDVSKSAYLIENAHNYLIEQVTNNLSDISGGLHFGSAGVALSLGSLSPQIGDSFFSDDQILNCFDRNTGLPNVMHGAAGQGLAMIQLMRSRQQQMGKMTLQKYATEMLSSQQKDGSWTMITDHKGTQEKVFNFGYGIAGIVYFLLEYHLYAKDEAALASAVQGLNFLASKAHKRRDSTAWTVSDKNKSEGKWWCDGTPGIALAFLKGYQVTHDSKFLEIGEKALRYHPKEIINKNLSQCHGITGLGELYLEAGATAENEKWQERSQWVAHMLIHMRNASNRSTKYWLTENIEFPTSDLMVGEGGIIHFLMRYAFPGRLSYPLL
jgi:lantibiotic modifying enzyme